MRGDSESASKNTKFVETYLQISEILKYKDFWKWKFLGEWFSICGVGLIEPQGPRESQDE